MSLLGPCLEPSVRSVLYVSIACILCAGGNIAAWERQWKVELEKRAKNRAAQKCALAPGGTIGFGIWCFSSIVEWKVSQTGTSLDTPVAPFWSHRATGRQRSHQSSGAFPCPVRFLRRGPGGPLCGPPRPSLNHRRRRPVSGSSVGARWLKN